MVALANALQRCTIHSGMPLDMLCGAIKELHGCLASVVESGDVVNPEMLNVAERDPTSEGRAPLLIPRLNH